LIAKALKIAQADPELSRWLEDEITSDRLISENLRSLTSPSRSKEDLLAQVHALRPRRRKFPARTLAAAALLLLSASLLINYYAFPPPVQFTQTQQPTVESFREQMAYFASQRFVLDSHSKELEQSREWLAQRDYPTFTDIPGPIINFEGMGCKKIDWHGHKVSLICFKNKNNEIVHLFTIDKSAFQNLQTTQLPQMLVHHSRQTGGFTTTDKIHLYVASQPGISITPLL
ncbi:MAG: hypothetical protein AAGC74_11875, partial [Verrucomicrobiota bacterium]